MVIFRREPHLTGALNAGGVGRNRDFEPLSDFLACCQRCSATARCYQHGAAGPWKVMTRVAGSKRRSLLTAGDDDEMFMTRSINVPPMTTEQHLLVFDTFDRKIDTRLCSTFCIFEAEAKHHAASLRQQSYTCICYTLSNYEVCDNENAIKQYNFHNSCDENASVPLTYFFLI